MEEQKNIETKAPVEYTTSLNDLNDPPKQKKSPVGGIIIFLLVLTVIALVAYIAYDKGYLDKLLNKEETKQQEKKEEQQEEQKEGEPQEKEITDASTIELLDTNLEVLNSYGQSYDFGLYGSIYELKELQDGDKLYSVLYYLHSNKKVTEDLMTNYPDYYQEFMKEHELTDEDLGEMPVSSGIPGKAVLIKNANVKELYKKVYGTEPTTTVAKDDFPEFFYNQRNDAYYVVESGAGSPGIQLVKYNYKYTEDKDYAYIYSAVAYYDPMGYKLYNDLHENNLVKEFDESTQKEVEEYVKLNMDKVNNYRVVFKKDGLNYIFEKVEEVK